MSGREKAKKYRKLINFIVFIVSKKSISRRYKLLEKHSRSNSNLSIAIRYAVIKCTAKKCGENVYISKSVILKNIESIEFGNNISIHEFCYIDGGDRLIIGDNVSIAHSTSIIASNHSFKLCNIPFKYQKVNKDKIQIGDNVWIGSKSIILAGTKICSNTVIAAGSVCTKTHEYNSLNVFAGNPAKPIKEII